MEIAKSTVFNCKADALCVSGLTAGSETNSQILKRVKDAVPDTVVLANTGCRPDTIEAQLSVADGAVVGTTFKVDGKFEKRGGRETGQGIHEYSEEIQGTGIKAGEANESKDLWGQQRRVI